MSLLRYITIRLVKRSNLYPTKKKKGEARIQKIENDPEWNQ